MPDYATQHHAPRAATASSGGHVDVRTLFLTASASAAAAYACSKIWAPGTLASAAFTPVLVALIKEALAKPTAAVARAVPIRGVVRGARPQGPQPFDAGLSATGDAGDPAASASLPRADDPDSAARVAQPGEIKYHGMSRGAKGWRLAIVTGLLGFVVCAAAFTVPELVAGRSAAGGGRVTTIFGGQHRSRHKPAVTTTTTTPTQTVTAPPETTVTVPAPVTATTTTPQPLTQTTTVPTKTTPAPTVTQPPVVPPG